MDFFISSAWAQAGASTGDPLLTFLPLILIFVVFYFLLIRPQQKRQKEHKAMVEAVQVGDEVVTAGGLLAKVTAVGEQFASVEVADGVVLRVQRHTIGSVLPKGTIKNAD
ncbi:MAG: preprotein translocase subunit YajC [Gammaproteobacteria bacterium]